MEALPTLMDLLTADLLIPLLPSLVKMATLSMGSPLPPRLVEVMECGVGQLQCVSVREIDFVYCSFVEFIISYTANCLELPSLNDGMIMYSAGSPDNRPFLSNAVKGG